MTQKNSNDTQNKSTGQQNEQSAHPHESEAETAARKAGQQPDDSSHDHMSRQKAGKDEGAGGGAKQKQNHR